MYSSNDNILPERIKILYICIFLLFLIIALRLWYVQVFKGDYYYFLSKKNRIRYEDIYAPRGIIRDIKNRIVAENLPAYALGIIREDCRTSNRCEASIKRISVLLDKDFNMLKENFDKGKKRIKPFDPLVLVRDLDFKDICKVEAHLNELPGIVVIPYPKRYYPYAEVGAHIIGYVGEPSEKDLQKYPYLQPGDVVGKSGVELVYENLLRGKKGKKQLEVTAQGRTLKERIEKEPISGAPIKLTVDMEVQKFIFQRMGEQRGACVVMDPFSGNVIAMVSKPSYNNNLLSHGISKKEWHKLIANPAHPLQHRAIASCYPPGSVFKLVVEALALQKLKDIKKKVVYCPGFYKLGNRIFRCWKKGGHGWVNYKEALKQSCDVYFYKLGEELGIDLISDFAKRCGFGQRTKIFLNGESACFIPSREWKLKRFHTPWQKGETLNTAIGQGYVLVSPIQVARFICALVNGGKILKPRISLQEKIEIVGELPVTKDNLEILKKIMIATVEEKHGTANIVKTSGIIIGAKTGTAQVVSIKSEEDRKKDLSEIAYEQRDHAWMAAFGLKGKRCYVVVVLVEHGGHGSSGAGPIVRDIFRFLFRDKEK
jgi:penicillin-binding protein 2